MTTDKEKEPLSEKHGVIFALVRNGNIWLEKRVQLETKFYGYTIVPGGE